MFDADYYYLNKEPLISVGVFDSVLESGASLMQKVTATAKQVKFKDAIFNPLMNEEKVKTGLLEPSYASDALI